MIDWSKGSLEDYEIASKIAKRATAELNFCEMSTQNISMDIIATHTHGCKLKLQELLDADLGDFLHDVCGINQHINHDTGELENCFLPRYAV